MIARLVGPRGRMEYVALHLDPTQAREVWVPVRQACEASELDAIKVCVREVQAHMEPLAWEAKRLYGLCDIRGRKPSDHEQERMRVLGRSVCGSIVRFWRNMARLADEPNTWDEVKIDAGLVAGRIVARVRASPEDTARRVQLAVRTAAKRHGCDLELVKERPAALEPVLADVAAELDVAGMDADEIRGWLGTLRRNIVGASEPAGGSDSTPASEPARGSEGEES